MHRDFRRNLTILQERIQTFEQTNKTLIEENLGQKSKIDQLDELVTKLTEEKEQIQMSSQRKLDVKNANISMLFVSISTFGFRR